MSSIINQTKPISHRKNSNYEECLNATAPLPTDTVRSTHVISANLRAPMSVRNAPTTPSANVRTRLAHVNPVGNNASVKFIIRDMK